MEKNYLKYWEKVKEKKKNQNLIFIHIPKTGGQYTSSILRKHKIKTKVHRPPINSEGINFTIIREPVQRFESYLNFLTQRVHTSEEALKRMEKRIIHRMFHFPDRLNHVFQDKNITLNQIVDELNNNDFKNFTLFGHQNIWCKEIDIIITIDKLDELLDFFGYKNIQMPKKNVSKKIRGTFNEKSIEKIKKIYEEDIVFYNKWNDFYKK